MKLLLLALFFPCFQPTTLSKPTQSPGKRIVRAAQDYLGALEALGASGSVLIERKKKVLMHMGFGLADRKRGVPCDEKTLFEIASATKPFTATAILCLVSDGKLALTDSIAKHLPGVPKAHWGISIEHLLTHTSGMPRSAAAGMGSDLEAAVAGYFSARPLGNPGSKYEYWNGGFALLAGIVEQVSGQSYMDFCRERIFKPAKMQASGFAGDELPEQQQAFGYSQGASRLAAGHAYQGSYGWHYKGMGGLVTSPGDLLAFTRALRSGKILKKKHVANMWRARRDSYGLGWGIASNTPSGGRRIGHVGDVSGFHASYQFFPDDDVTIIVLLNSNLLPAWKVGWDLEAIVFGKEPSYVRFPAAPKRNMGAHDGLQGVYRDAHDAEFLVAYRGSGLLLQAQNARAGALIAGQEFTPEQAASELRIAEIFQALTTGDGERLTTHVVERFKARWGKDLANTIWPAHLERLGPLEGHQLFSIQNLGDGHSVFWIKLQHAAGSAWLKGTLQQDQLASLQLQPKEDPPVTSKGFLRTGKNLYQDHNLADNSSQVQLKVQIKSRKVHGIKLQFEEGTTVDCARVH